MRMKKSFLLLWIAFPSVVFAGGFQLNLQGQKQIGMGSTGVGFARDASTLFYNPAGMSSLDTGFHFHAGMSLLFPSVSYLEGNGGMYTAQTVPNTGTPFSFYAVARLKKQPNLAIGLGAYTPFGSRQQWESDWIGQFLLREIDLKTIFIQPTLSWKFSDAFSIGGGLVIATGSFGLAKGIPAQDTTAQYGSATLDGKASGMGYQFGLYHRSENGFSAGLTYRSAVKANIENGTATFETPSSLSAYFPNTTFNTSITLPWVANLGLGYEIDRWNFACDINYVGWSTYDSLIIDFADNTEKLADQHSGRKYENSFIFRLGAEFYVRDLIWLRAGVYFDQTPVQDGYLTPETPDANKLGISAGLSISRPSGFSLDLSFLYIEGKKRSDTNLETGFSGTYKARAFIPGIGFSYHF
jgi:long-chain fatty acid transport protein